jgi:CrcB protein
MGSPLIVSLLAVALGAALGAWLRWVLGVWLNPATGNLPIGTLAANLIGGFLVGIAVAAFADRTEIAPAWRLFIITGFLGGLTTFSTFSAESVALLMRGSYGWALAHAGAHLFGSLALTALGIATYRAFA